MTKILRLATSTASIICLCFGTLFSGAVVAQGNLVIPTWFDLFNVDGTLKDAVDAAGAANHNGVRDYAEPPYSGIDAIFVGDWISQGVATDMSALSDADDLGEIIVWNGTVRLEHDVGNAFVFATTDGATNPNLVLYGAAERFGTAAPSSYIEFEFNQDKVQAISPNTPLMGSRSDDDLLVRLNLATGALTTAQIMRWVSPGGYQVIATITATAGTECSGDGVSRLACDPYLASGTFDSESQFVPWDDYPRDLFNQPVTVSAPNGLLEFGVNVGALLGTNPDYTSIMVRTPEDIILDSFRNLGYWASASAPSSGN
jgi:hypothetical protein